jgi:hypothetical protein
VGEQQGVWRALEAPTGAMVSDALTLREARVALALPRRETTVLTPKDREPGFFPLV